MITKDDIDILVPTKVTSTRVPNKNFADFFGGKSLFEIKLDQLVKLFPASQIHVCDSVPASYLLEKERFQSVSVLSQPVSWVEDFEYMIGQLQRPYVMIARATTPFVNTACMRKFLEDFMHQDVHHSAVSVIEIQTRILSQEHEPLNFSIGKGHMNTQDIPKIYAEVAGVSLVKLCDAKKYHYHYAPNPFFSTVDPVHGLDINFQADWDIAKSLADKKLLD